MSMTPHRVTATFLLASVCLGALAHAQSPPRFEVASLKPNVSGGRAQIVRTPGGLTATNSEFSTLLQMAFQTRLIDFSRVLDSLRSERFDIVAKAAGKIRGDQYWEMLQTLLEERFKLTFHRETKDAPVYALIFAKKGRTTGPKLSRSIDSECPVNPNGANFCGVSSRPGMMTGQRISLGRIARELSPFAGRTVQDETGLTGSFDFQLMWTPDQSVSKLDGDKVKAAGITLDPSGPSFFSAIQEQLGLKLQPKKGRVEILVIDHAEQPSAN
jgi:uncharacterized protein (TIGR03435 family)